jgi:hypothetical protein
LYVGTNQAILYNFGTTSSLLNHSICKSSCRASEIIRLSPDLGCPADGGLEPRHRFFYRSLLQEQQCLLGFREPLQIPCDLCAGGGFVCAIRRVLRSVQACKLFPPSRPGFFTTRKEELRPAMGALHLPKGREKEGPLGRSLGPQLSRYLLLAIRQPFFFGSLHIARNLHKKLKAPKSNSF